ncbi:MULTISPECIES: C45 family autoproteolytic acyltransferase/hydolase [Sphingomonadales]|uniref:C45 family peptidase n=3 Tax=Sphingomonadaceae TaxID=41297 RepID=A0ABT8ZRJ8_9SPHN|nr:MULTISPECIES: C45 family peptidase [Sphingomonadales]MDF8335862.1 C45 family autoproteolytic acyltransferase/hydrolase [Novosphingobium cyanobacteriorum]MDO7837169.1 C45 family peptidase [Sphingobium sp. HBC34]
MQVFSLAGEPKSRGLAHGRTHAAAIKSWLGAWLKSLQAAGVGNPDVYARRFLAESGLVVCIEHDAPDLLEEIRGTSLGANVPFDLVLAAQLMDEEWEYRRSQNTRFTKPEKCSTLAIASAGSPVWIGQNMDLGAWTDGHQVVLHIAEPDGNPDALVFSLAGMIGLMGVNECGLAVAVNALPELSRLRPGLPVAFIIRKLLQATSLTDASAVLLATEHATCQHYLLADPTGLRSFEVGHDTIVELSGATADRLFHTNHALAPQLQQVTSTYDQLNSKCRLTSLSDRLTSAKPTLTVIQNALCASDHATHPVCRPHPGAQSQHNTNFTTGSMIARLEFRVDLISAWFSIGPPDRDGYHALRFED